MFLSDDIDAQPGLISLLPQVRDAVRLPVVAAGGISDGRGIAAAFALGADAVQIGTAYLRTPEATISPMHRAALASARDDATRLTNVFTGRPARGLVNRFVAEVGPMSEDAPQFPLAAGAAAPLRAAAEKLGSGDFSPLWAGEAAALARDEGAEALTRRLWAEGQAVMAALSGRAGKRLQGSRPLWQHSTLHRWRSHLARTKIPCRKTEKRLSLPHEQSLSLHRSRTPSRGASDTRRERATKNFQRKSRVTH